MNAFPTADRRCLRAPAPLVLSALAVALAACAPGPRDRSCGSDEECRAGERCSDGECVPPDESPDAGGGAPDGGCVPRTCGEKNCGSFDDGCGGALSCGGCPAGETCGGAGVANVCAPGECEPETEAALCARLGAECGTPTVTDRCGAVRTVSCGACPAGGTCSVPQFACVCTAETDAAFCERLGRTCGIFSGTDNCGRARSANCGSCGAGSQCSAANVCECVAETNPQFCARLGKNCGTVTAPDNCGSERRTSCGVCPSGVVCSATNTCGCAGETTEAFCARLGKECGPVSGTDNCGLQRNVDCGGCSAPKTCGGGGVSNRCACAPETNPAFCSRLGKTCGTVTAPDNCGASRTAACGTCGEGQSCSGANVCTCAGETDAAFCARLQKNCGTVTGTDNCGRARAASCGACAGAETCGGAGIPNVCGVPSCNAETDGELCFAARADCGQITRTDRCGASRTVACGGCSPNQQCGLESANVCGPRLCEGGFCWENPVPLARSFNDVWAASATDAWAVGAEGSIMHWDGTLWRAVPSPTTELLVSVWGASATDVWAVGRRGTALRYDGSTWSRVNLSTTLDLGAVWAQGSEVFIATGAGTVKRFNGIAWSTYTVDPLNYPFSGIWGSSPLDVYVVGRFGVVYRFDGTSWKKENSANMSDLYDVWGVGGQVWAAGQGTDYGPAIRKRSVSSGGTVSWIAQTVPDGTGGLSSIAGSATNDLYAAGRYGQLVRWNGSAWSQVAGNPYGGGVYQDYKGLFPAGGTLFLTGYPGSLIRYQGGSFAVLPAGVSGDWQSVWGSSDANVFAVGYGGKIARFDGAHWQQQTSGTTVNLHEVWGSDASFVLAVGDEGTVLRWNGTTWSPMTSNTTETLLSVSGTGPDDAWAGGLNGTLLRWNGTAWTKVPVSGLTAQIQAIWMRTAADGWLGTNLGAMYRWNGTTWTKAAGGSGGWTSSIWGASENLVWAGTSSGPLAVWNGTSWSPVTQLESIRQVFGWSAQEQWALRGDGNLYKWNAAQSAWELVRRTPVFGAAWGSSPNNVVFVGSGAGIARWRP